MLHLLHSSRKSKVCMTFFFDFYFDGAHSLIPRVKRHFSYVQRFFEEITVVTIDNRNFTEIFKGTKVTHRPLLPLRVPHLVRGVLGALLGLRELMNVARLGRDIVLFSSPYAPYSVFVSRLLKVPLIIHFKYDPTTQPSMNLRHRIKRGILNAMINLALRSADMIVVTTSRIKRMVIDRKVLAEKVFVSPNYVDEDLFSLSADGKSIRERFSVAEDEKIVTYIGRLSHEKGLDVLIEAFSMICNQLHDAKLLIVGEGIERGSLKEKCQKFGLRNKVLFVKSIPHTSVPNFLAGSDVVVLPSYSEGHPKFLIEAMVMGKPIVATDVIGINDVVRDGKEALLVKPGDANALAGAMKLLLKNKKLARALGHNARKKALKEYSKRAVFKLAKGNPFLILGF